MSIGQKTPWFVEGVLFLTWACPEGSNEAFIEYWNARFCFSIFDDVVGSIFEASGGVHDMGSVRCSILEDNHETGDFKGVGVLVVVG